MINIGAPELLLILLVALIVLGPAKLPEAARQVGRAVGELRRMSSGFQAELRDAIQEPLDGMPSLKPTDLMADPSPKTRATTPGSQPTDPPGDTPPAPDTGTNGATPR